VSLRAVKRDCLRSHSEHKAYPKLLDTGSWCSDLVVASQQYSVEELSRMAGFEPDRLHRVLQRAQAKMFSLQHERLHRDIGVNRRCTGCTIAA
jgi:hypothetical protein